MRIRGETFGPVAQKTLLLLTAGVALGLTNSPRRQFYIINQVAKEWRLINERALKRAIRRLYESKLIDAKDNDDGTTTIVLTQKGKNKALTYKIDDIEIPKMKKWDGKWRIVVFDVPEKFKKARKALARALKIMNFYPLQKSVFVHPFECENEIDFVVEFFSVRPCVRYILADHIDNELHIKHHFGL